MPEGVPTKFASTEEEIAFLRERIALRERELLARSPEADQEELETVGKEQIYEYGTFTPDSVLQRDHMLSEEEFARTVNSVGEQGDKVEQILSIAIEKGIHTALTVLDTKNDAYLSDEVHRSLVALIKSGKEMQDLKEGVPPWHLLHMTLYEVTLPETAEKGAGERPLSELMSMMTQFYAGMQSIGQHKVPEHYVLEVAVSDKSDDIVFYVSVPNQYVDLFEKQILSLFPHAVLTEQRHDYNIFTENGVHMVSTVSLQKHPIYPIRTFDTFESDPLAVVLNAFSKIERDGGGASLQFCIKTPKRSYQEAYEGVIRRIKNGMSVHESIARSTIGGEFMHMVAKTFGDILTPKKESESTLPKHDIDLESIELFKKKIHAPVLDTNIRIAVSATSSVRAEQILKDIEATFYQFQNTNGNNFTFKREHKKQTAKKLKAYSFRAFHQEDSIPLSIEELATVLHFPGRGIASSPQFKQSRAKTAAAPTDMPMGGTLLGLNKHRGVEKEIYITAEDRLRHFYIIGQTGTGKTTLMKNMIAQDIKDGAGVCMIDPHGTDIEDVLATIPPERASDVIYFDPARLDRVVGLNMLEYDPQKPEQKTFVVNELFSIFQKLYGSVPESMGPMFEQYFRNATMLVLEDPQSGNTLMDISRVMADARYRRQKLEKATNPVVVQFWREIATKAGGEAALENIVPYITSKFDVFTANEYMRPIIGQQTSAFNFRSIMDEQKILLVNLSKGRLGEINAHLIGMIIVGKLLMAALSRVDDQTRSFPPFYLHMDEFQNVSTNSISAILSEARKYKLGLTIAHQFIDQLEEGIKHSVFGNVGSIAAFRVGPSDAEYLAHQFAPTFEAQDLMNVPNHTAYVRLLANGVPTKPFSVATIPPSPSDHAYAAELVELSYSRYGRSRTEVEHEIQARYMKETPRLHIDV